MFRRLFDRKKNLEWRAPDGCRGYVIGDVHGRLDLLQQLVAKIEEDNSARAPARVWLVLLGDLVDRGPDSRGVLEWLTGHRVGFAETVHIKGNHEEYFLRVLQGDIDIVQHWLNYGGLECAESYGVSSDWLLNATPAQIVARLQEAVPASHLELLESMADTLKFGDYLLVHAGIRPGVDLHDQTSKDLRWIRDGFLEDSRDHGFVVVHGHTIVAEPDVQRNRIGIDTGAYKTGSLTALALEGADRRFLQVRETILAA